MKKQFRYSKIKDRLSPELVDGINTKLAENNINTDDIDVVRKEWVELDTKSVKLDEGSRSAVKYVSTRTVDQVGDVIIPKGVDLSLFKKTGMPCFWNHDYSKPPIGSDEWIKKDDWGVKVKTVYGDTGEGTLANIIWSLVQQGHQKQSSVGIIPLEVIRSSDVDFKKAVKALSAEWPEFKKSAKDCSRIITKCLLFEHSDCSLACNTDTDVLAVSKMFMDNGADEKLLKQLGLPIPVSEGSITYTPDNQDSFEIKINTDVIVDEVVAKIKEKDELEVNKGEFSDKDIEGVELDIEVIDKNAKPSDPFDHDDDKKDEPEPIEPITEPIEVKVVKKVTLVKEPYCVKLIHKPQYSIDKDEVKAIISAEIRKKMGRLL